MTRDRYPSLLQAITSLFLAPVLVSMIATVAIFPLFNDAPLEMLILIFPFIVIPALALATVVGIPMLALLWFNRARAVYPIVAGGLMTLVPTLASLLLTEPPKHRTMNPYGDFILNSPLSTTEGINQLVSMTIIMLAAGLVTGTVFWLMATVSLRKSKNSVISTSKPGIVP